MEKVKNLSKSLALAAGLAAAIVNTGCVTYVETVQRVPYRHVEIVYFPEPVFYRPIIIREPVVIHRPHYEGHHEGYHHRAFRNPTGRR